MSDIKIFVKRPGEKLCEERIPNTLKAMQETVGGYIEEFPLLEDCVIICNEEGKIKGLPYNCQILNEHFVGTIFFAGVKGDEFADVPGELRDMERLLPELFKDGEES